MTAGLIIVPSILQMVYVNISYEYAWLIEILYCIPMFLSLYYLLLTCITDPGIIPREQYVKKQNRTSTPGNRGSITAGSDRSSQHKF